MKTKRLPRMGIHVLLVGFLTAWGAGAAAPADAAWTTGGPYGGYVRSLAMAGSTPDIMYAGTEQGIFRTTDSGANWVKPGDAALFALVLVVDPVHAAVVYAGTVDGLYKSVDAGVHWTRKGFEGAVVNAVAIHPADTGVLYVGTGVAGAPRRPVKPRGYSRALTAVTPGS